MPAVSRRALYDATEALRAEVEARHTPAVLAVVQAAGQAAADAMDAGQGADEAAAAYERPLALAVAAAMLDAHATFARAAFGQMRPDDDLPAAPDLPDPADALALKRGPAPLWLAAATAYVRAYALAAARYATDTLRRTVARVLARGLDEGQPVPDIARALRTVWPDVARHRAITIVRTEVVAASNAGSAAGARSTGLRLRKEWIATRDARTRDTHRRLDGVTVDADAPFTVGGHQADLPGDPSLPAGERVRCRCTVGWVPVEEEAGEPAAAVPVRSWRDERDDRMRARYAETKQAHPFGADGAIQEIADAVGLSFDQARRIIRQGRRR